MRILHTSDWHLGRSLYGKKRYEEFEKFLTWLEKTIKEEKIDTLIVSGDIFDNSTPGNRAQEIYYNFLRNISASSCRNTIITAGNHDSPSFLNAPREILKFLNVYVVGSASDNPEDEVFVLYDNEKKPEAVVCAVPYLRDRDIRTADAGESYEEKNIKLVEGVKNHYRAVCQAAEKKINQIAVEGFQKVPLIATGHLFTAGGKTVEGDGVRDLYVGSLAHIGKDIFPSSIDYLALGHLHVPQIVGGDEKIRYSGSPLPMGFGEANQEKIVIIADFINNDIEITVKPVPCFQRLERITGDIQKILEKIDQLRFENSRAWIEVEYTGNEGAGNIREILEESVNGTAIEIRRIKNKQFMQKIVQKEDLDEELDNLNEKDVFIRCLDSYEVPEDERAELIAAHSEIVNIIHEEDLNRE